MSEAITKACNAYRCDGGICKYTEMPWATCSKCKGTGRVPDVKAALRAEVVRLEKELDVERAWHRSTKLSLSDEHASRQYWEREANTDHRGEAQEAKRNEAHARDMERRVTVALKEVEVENKGLRAEVARLTAEVERLNGREQAAKPLIGAIKHTGDNNNDESCPLCWGYWSDDGRGCADGCPRAAWLAGCKS